MGDRQRMYDAFFFMELDNVPIKHYWLEQFEMEAAGMAPGDLAARGSQHLGDKWDLLKHVMPEYLVEHVNGNVIYNVEHNWTKYFYATSTSDSNDDMMEGMAFGVAFAMIIIRAVMDEISMFHAGWMAALGGYMTYNWHSMLVGNYASTLLNTSFGFPTYILHGSSKNLFESLDDDEVTLGVAFFDMRGRLKETVPTSHPIKRILDLAYFDQATMTEEIVAPGCNVDSPTGAEYNDWKLSSPMFSITNEFVTKDKPRYGWRVWTSLWNPARLMPVRAETSTA